MKLSKGDAVTYVALVISAALQALEPWRKEASVPPDSPDSFQLSMGVHSFSSIDCRWLHLALSPNNPSFQGPSRLRPSHRFSPVKTNRTDDQRIYLPQGS
jgi:hypothetical protein